MNAESPRTLYHLRRASRLAARLRFESKWLTPTERASLLSRIHVHQHKAKTLAILEPTQ